MAELKYPRVLLKLSGEALAGGRGFGFDFDTLRGFAQQVKAITELGAQVGLVIGGGNIQPCLARRRDGTLVTFMRDNGPPPKRVLVAESTDRGEHWGPVTDSQIPNPGSGCDIVALRDGSYAFQRCNASPSQARR